MSTLRKVLFVSLPLAAAGALWFGHQTQSASAADRPAIARPAVLVAPGRVETLRDPVALAFETGGRIVAIEVDEGQAVKAGQVVARLDDRMAAARVASARAAVAGAQASYLMSKRGARTEDLEAAKAELEAAQVAADHNAAERERSAKLGISGAISSSSVDADDATARVSAAQAAAAQARYTALVKGTRTEQVAAAAASLDAAKAELAAAEVALDQTVLRAPHDGVVLRRFAEVGALVTTVNPSPIISIADLGKLEIRAELDEADVAAIAVGTPAYATADAFGERHFPVRISRITSELGRKTVRDDDPRARVDTRVQEVIATFEGTPNESLPLGLRMYVHVEK
ncbi:MAG TPA: efflux RND transporter periplasmic adaptor subunit [Kofleriaceae bacterium]|nr:efflux RND transporter periplasmic adaptor subunit [Kofleriaceae bacterium]